MLSAQTYVDEAREEGNGTMDENQNIYHILT